MTTTRARLVTAAFALFEEQGFHETTVEDITARAGTGRTTFFRHFRGKEDVVFPDHEQLLARVDARLRTATPDTRDVALREAARIVLDHYLDEGEAARARYRLTRAVPALRDRESTSVQHYLRLFRRHTLSWLSDQPNGDLRAELLSSAVITAHNHVLRSWLRGESTDVSGEFDAAISWALAHAGRPPEIRPATTVIVHSHGQDVEQVVRDVRAALTGDVDPT
jgi:AcrR family transcriptional regulator